MIFYQKPELVCPIERRHDPMNSEQQECTDCSLLAFAFDVSVEGTDDYGRTDITDLQDRATELVKEFERWS